VYGLKVNVPPPLPAQLASTRWLCITQGYNVDHTSSRRFQWYHFTADPAALGPFNANTLAQDWHNYTHPLIQGTYRSTTVSTAIYVFAWDGTRLHTGAQAAGIPGGLLFFIKNRPTGWSVLIKKWGWVGSGQINGWWRSADVSSTWADPDHKLTALGMAQFANWENLLKQPFVSEGNTWTPAIWSPKGTGDLYKVEMVQTQPRLHYYHKHRFVPSIPLHAHDNTWLYPTLNP